MSIPASDISVDFTTNIAESNAVPPRPLYFVGGAE
jgi:hypothetical protein